MKKIRPFAPLIAAGAGLIGALLRQWFLSGGVDERGLYPSGHPGWVLYLILSAGILLLLWLLSRTDAPSAPQKPLFGLVGRGLALLGLLFYNAPRLGSGDILDTLVSLVGLAAALAMLPTKGQLSGNKPPHAVTYALPCLYFVLRLFTINRGNGGETEFVRFLPQIFAVAAAALASYRLWGNTVKLDDEKGRLFWQCAAGYLCLAAAPGAHWMYVCVGLWLLADGSLISPPSGQEQSQE